MIVGTLLRHTLLRLLSPEIGLSVDEDGLPVVDYGRRLGMRIGRRRNPTTIAILGLKATDSASLVGLPEFDKTGDEILPHVSVERIARWLMDSSIDRGGYMVFHIDFPWPTYFLTPPWTSCLSEGFGGMFLIVYGTAKKNQGYVDCGLKHLKSLLVPVSKGGLRSDDSKYFLEYAGYDGRRRWPIVLNGHLYCLVTLFNAWRTLGIPEFRVAFEQAVSGLDTLLPIFEGPFFTYYDDYGNPAKLFYHRLHIHLLEKLYELSKLSYLRATAERWGAMLPKYNFTLALLMRAYSMRIPYLPRR
jgi:hypothetical protein